MDAMAGKAGGFGVKQTRFELRECWPPSNDLLIHSLVNWYYRCPLCGVASVCPIGEELRRVFLQASIALTDVELGLQGNTPPTPWLAALLQETSEVQLRAIANLSRHIKNCPACKSKDSSSRI